jgi:DNA-binding CsgD family transcriptional regulator
MSRVARSRVTSPRLVGRDDELRALVNCGTGQGTAASTVALVSGRAGMGKSRLVAEAAARLRAEGVTVLSGAALPFGPTGPPYVPLCAALRGALPETAPVLRALTGATSVGRTQLCELLRLAVSALAERARLVLVIEDLHWLDPATGDALVYLLTQPVSGRWGLILTRRYEDQGGGGSNLIDYLQTRPLVRVSLEAMEMADVADQVAAITGRAPTTEELDRIYRRSGGIPLLVEEVAAAGTTGLPEHLRSLFLDRVRSVGHAVYSVVAVVAVVEQGCDENDVAEVLGVDAGAALAALEAAVAADLLVLDPGGFRVRHDLLREVVYDALPPGRRRDLHAGVARALSRRNVEPAELARHWYRAGFADEAARASLAAAREAERDHAPAAAHRHLERVLQLWTSLSPDVRALGVSRTDVARRAAAAAEREGAFVRAIALAEELVGEDRNDPNEQARRWSRLAAYRLGAGDGRGCTGAFEHALLLLPGVTDPLVRADVLAGYARFLGLTGNPERARLLADQAKAVRVEDAITRCRVLMAWGQSRVDGEDGLQALKQARDLAVALDAGQELAVSHAMLELSLERRGRIHEREPVLRAGLRYVAAHGLRGGTEAVLQYQLAGLLLDLGRWDEAEEILQAIRGRIATGFARYFATGFAARLAAARGNEDVEVLVTECRGLAEAIPQQPVPLRTALMAAAEAALWAGRPKRAEALAREAWEQPDQDPGWRAEVLAVLTRAWAARAVPGPSRRRTAPVDLVRSSVDLDRPDHPRVHAFVLSARAELNYGAGARDVAEWREVVDAWTRASDPYRTACARLRLAWALLRSRTGRVQAASELGEAARVATALGARPLLQAVGALANAARVPLDRRPATRDRFGLTPRELEVLRLLIAGLTNADIGVELGLSPRTVGVHVSRILHKLGAARRTEAAEIARRSGLGGVRRSTDVLARGGA